MIGTVKKINIPAGYPEMEKSGSLFIVPGENPSQSKPAAREITFLQNKYLADNRTVINTEVIALIREGRYTEAEIILSDILNENPDDSCAANNLGVIFELEGKFESSMNMYYKACSIDPGNTFYKKNFLYLLDAYRQ